MRTLLFALLLATSAPRSFALDPVLEAADLRQPGAPAITKAAAAKKPKLRALAAKAWGQIMSEKAVKPLAALARDHIPFVREEAAFALGQLGWQDLSAAALEEIRASLSALLSDRQLSVRLAAAEALGKTGLEKAPELLAPALAAKEAPLRAAAVLGLFRARMILKLRDPANPPGELPEELRLRLEALAADKDPALRHAVAYFFARNSEPKAEGAVAPLLRDKKDRWTRTFAAMALGRMKAKAAKRELVLATADSEMPVRLAALSALLAAGESALEAPALAGDKSFHVRAAFAAGLSAEKPAELEVLAGLAADDSPTVRAEALKALAKSKKEGLLAWLRAQSGTAHWLVREAAVQASGGAADQERAGFLKEFLTDPEVAVRAAALEALLAMPGDATFTQLKESLESPELALRGIAVAALKERKEKEALSLAWSTYGRSLAEKWVELREELVDVFAQVAVEESTGYLRQLLQDPAGGVRAKARKALGARGVTDLPSYPEPPLSRSPHRELTFRHAPLIELVTSRGRVVVETFPQDAPVHVADLVGNVRKGYYDGLAWHRVVSNFVVQGGDPDGSGWGGSGYSLRAEVNRKPFLRGALGMPRSQGFDTGGSQLFFSLVPTPHLDGQYTVFGRVTEGADVLDLLERGDRIVSAKVIHKK